MIKKLKKTLQKISEYPAISHKFNRDHIFYDILKSIKSHISPDKKLKLIFLFSEIEKALKLLKKHEDYTSQVTKVILLFEEADPEIKYYLRLSFHPMVALFYFEEKKYQLAIQNLEYFFNFSNKILKNRNLLNLANGEQYLNILRVFAKTENKDFYITTSNLLHFALNDKVISHENKLLSTENKFTSWTNEMDENELSFWKIYISNNVLKKFIREYKSDLNLICSYMIQLENKDSYVTKSFESLNLYFENDFESSIYYLIDGLSNRQQIIPSLLFLNLKYLQKCIDKLNIFDEELNSIISTLSNKILKENKDLVIYL